MSKEILAAITEQVHKEPYAQKLSVKALKVEPGYALTEMKYTDDMTNLLGMMHGGAIFSLIDEAFELAGNSHGTIAVALNMNITYMAAPKIGSLLHAEAKEVSRTSRTGTYQIRVTDDAETLIALCQALVYRKKDVLPFLENKSEH
jgi:acyl-CoA thioesterase